MKEIVILSGKGGTGKTSLAASLAVLADSPTVVVDADVDAANLHLVLGGRVVSREPFMGGMEAGIAASRCTACGECMAHCRFGAIRQEPGGKPQVDPLLCEGCGVCSLVCPAGAVTLTPATAGEWLVSETRVGAMFHGALAPGGQNSGKLVTLLRERARDQAQAVGAETIVVDGPPGVACPAIASLAGADLAILVTEPSAAGLHDLERAAQLCAGFGVRAGIVLNKADLVPELAAEVTQWAAARQIPMLGSVPYHPAFNQAQMRGLAVVENGRGVAAQAIICIWHAALALLGGRNSERRKQ